MSKFRKIFSEGVGQLEGEYKIKLDKTVPPVQRVPCRINGGTEV